MILVTGATGFIGRNLVRQLARDGHRVRVLLRPTQQSPDLPKGVPVEIALSSLVDERNLLAALSGVEAVYHLVGGEWQGTTVDLSEVEIVNARSLLDLSKRSGVQQIMYLSHLGADRASAYPVLKVKGIVEELIRSSGLDYTIIRTGLVYGPQDNFTTDLAKLLALFPFFALPGAGDTLVQPVWIDDLVAALAWSFDADETRNQVLKVGGPEFLSIKEIVEQISRTIGVRRPILQIPPQYLRLITIWLEYIFPRVPLSVYWNDYLAINRTCEIDSFTRSFGILPSRFSHNIDYLSQSKWRSLAWRELTHRG